MNLKEKDEGGSYRAGVRRLEFLDREVCVHFHAFIFNNDFLVSVIVPSQTPSLRSCHCTNRPLPPWHQVNAHIDYRSLSPLILGQPSAWFQVLRPSV